MKHPRRYGSGREYRYEGKMSQSKQEIHNEIQRRRTFAIISHPDAGKTTMTEKLLLYGGAIHLAGTVKGRKSARHATSDWMEIEKQRGISVSSSVLQFSYEGHCINILDTPGHQDFSEDTYRTLCAADAAVMMIDGARGVQEQTIKLFKVCRMRGIPIFTFINKMDRAAKNPFDLMDELEKVLGIFSTPFNWPIGIDGDFKGVYNRCSNEVELFEGSGDHGASKVRARSFRRSDPELAEILKPYYLEKLDEEIELLSIAGDDPDMDKIRSGQQTPLFFGSAITNFGVEFFLREFIRMAPAPFPRKSDRGMIDPVEEPFSAFVFKIQANMNPNHHDRLAFIRINSGRFEKDMDVLHVRSKRRIKLAQPTQMLADERAHIESAYAGDIIGLFDSGNFHLGDSLTSGEPLNFEPIPVFPPEFFARISATKSLKRKAFQKGILQLAEEGAIQVYKEVDIGTETFVIGVVGELQFDVLQFRLKSEYQLDLSMQRLPWHVARWVESKVPGKPVPKPSELTLGTTCLPVFDSEDRLVLLFESEWATGWVLDRNPSVTLKSIND